MKERNNSALLAALAFGAALQVAAAPDPAAAQTTHITISHSQQTVDFLPLWIASDAGYFKKRGLDVTVRYLPAQEGVPAILTGEVQMAGIGASDAGSAVAQGAKLTLVGTLTPIYTFQFWARPDHASANALKGQRIGITSTTGSLYAGTLLALKQLGLSTSDVVLTPLGGATNVNSSLLAGSVVAAASHPPATYKFKQAGLVELVDLPKSKIPSVSAGLWVTEAYIQAHRDIVQAIVDAVVEAFHRERSDRAYAESEITAHLGVKDKAALDFTYDFYVNEILPEEPMPEAAQIQGDIDALIVSNPKVKNLDAAKMLDQSFVKKASASPQ
ncbi:MAG TPA: ABC transporter substrate-binding protein [Xanthobacteraceae bacterium]|nr:ABC transporter substrate-binding protein [Xanthobacteraceae bacterium]